MAQICCVFNTPSLYRELIYSLIDSKYDCDWYFEDTDNKLKEFDITRLHNPTRLHTIRIGPFYWVKGMLGLLRKKEYNQFLMMGHSRNITTLIFLILKNFFYPQKRVYLWTHGFYGKESILERLWKTLLYKSADTLLIYGDYSCRLMSEMGLDKTKIKAIHNSLNYDAQLILRNKIKPSPIYLDHFGNNNPVIIFIGRLNAVKRLEMVMYAIASLKNRGEKYNVVLVGDGPEKNKLYELAQSLKIADCVWFYGASYDENCNAELIYNADLCVAPGNIGLTAMHVMMFGCPAISHNLFSHQMPEFEAIKEYETGRFFEYNNQESLNDSISQWFSSSNYDREKIRQACFREIDTRWSPYYQMDIINSVIL